MSLEKIKRIVLESYTIIVDGVQYYPYSDDEEGSGVYVTSEDCGHISDGIYVEYSEIDLSRDKFFKLVEIDQSEF